jgi:predicted transcriptional regulator
VIVNAGDDSLESLHVQSIEEALDEADSGSPGVPHEAVVRWLESWGTDGELPPPREECGRCRG